MLYPTWSKRIEDEISTNLSIDSDVSIRRLELFDRHADRRIFRNGSFIDFTFENRIPVVDVANGDVDSGSVNIVAVGNLDSQNDLECQILKI